MTDREQELRRQAEQARRFANSVAIPEDRRFWLDLAAEWDALADRVAERK
jgi:hypothetical protein